MVEKRHNGIRRTSLTQSLLFISVFYLFTLGSSNFQLVDQFKTYQEAKSYCRDMYIDLVTVHNLTVMNELITLAANKTPRAWIGLEIADVPVWHWSQPDQKTDFFNWKLGEPQDEDPDTCVAMDQHGKWFESECQTTRSFVCQDNNDNSKQVLVTQSKSWRDAQSHCRDSSSELVSIHSIVENAAVQNISASKVVWIGLFKDPWMWSDGSNSSFRFWRPNQPNYLEDQYCTVAVFRVGGQWNDLRCQGKRWFICYGEKKTISTTASTEIDDTTSDSPNQTLTTQTRMPFEASIGSTVTLTPEMTDLPSTTDWTTTEEETTISAFASSPQKKTTSSSQNEEDSVTTDSPTRTTEMMTSSEAATVSTVTSTPEMTLTTVSEFASSSSTELYNETTETPTTIDITTTEKEEEEEATTVSEFASSPGTKIYSETTETPTTIDITTTEEEEEATTVSEFASSLITELYSETTETPTVTLTQSKAKVDLTTVIDSTTPLGTSVQSTTHSSNLTPTVSSPSSSDNLLLIQENMTWIEAMGYCREHHIDLVNILNKELQDEVAEKAKSATTAYVWLGLRYSCKFDLWFWTSSSSGCYQSWAPGHGSEWEYDCGVTGAMEATGRHQWVGLSQGNKLNFICSTCSG